MSCPFWLNLKLHTLKKNNKINSKQHSFLVVFVPNSLTIPPPLSARLKTNIALLIGYNVEDYVFSKPALCKCMPPPSTNAFLLETLTPLILFPG